MSAVAVLKVGIINDNLLKNRIVFNHIFLDQFLSGKYNRLYQLRKEYPHLQTGLSVGGATWSGNFAQFSSTDQGRKNLASSCIKIMLDYGFDGLDIDWEFPDNSAQGRNYFLLLREMRTQLNALRDGSRYFLSIATRFVYYYIMNIVYYCEILREF
jgi:chitinase